MKHLLTLLLLATAAVAAPADDTRAALRILRPELVEQRDFTVGANGSITSWSAPRRFAQPNGQQLAEAKALLAARRETILALRAGLRVQFEALAAGEKVLFDGALAKVKTHLIAGRIAEAREVIETIPLPASLEMARAAMLAEFPQP